uniref:FUN14 domain-containing protein 1 n=1 Tax=Moschus moschiferus TaxID=68415 RepID=A0A8C6D4P2_MOSMO
MAHSNSPPKEYESDDDFYDMLDLTEYVRRHHWWNLVFGHSSGPVVENYSVATQIVMDEVSDRCAGFLFQKVGKLAATAVGGSFLLLQIATTELVKQNLVISGGFVGGFLLGLKSSGYECSVMVVTSEKWW